MFLLHPLVIPVYSDFNIIYTGKDHTENQQKLLLIGYRIVSFASSEGYNVICIQVQQHGMSLWTLWSLQIRSLYTVTLLPLPSNSVLIRELSFLEGCPL